MILAFIFVTAAYVLSKKTTPPQFETWKEVQTKIDNK